MHPVHRGRCRFIPHIYANVARTFSGWQQEIFVHISGRWNYVAITKDEGQRTRARATTRTRKLNANTWGKEENCSTAKLSKRMFCWFRETWILHSFNYSTRGTPWLGEEGEGKVGKVEKLISACLLAGLVGKNLIIFAWQPMQIAEQNIKVRGRAESLCPPLLTTTKAGEYLLSSRPADQQKIRKTTRKLNDRLLKWKQLNALEMVRNAGKLLLHDKPHQPKVTKGCLLFTSFLTLCMVTPVDRVSVRRAQLGVTYGKFLY